MESRAYTQAYVIINELSEEIKNKIPEKIINAIKSKMNKAYEFVISDEDIEKMELLEDTEKILSVIYTDYLATDEERKIIKQKEKSIFLNKEKEKQEKYGKLIFPKKNKN